MKIKYLSLFFIVCCCSFTQPTPEKMLWSEKPLNWMDFNGTPKPGTRLDIYSSMASAIQMGSPLVVDNEIHFTIAAWFFLNDSWVQEPITRTRKGYKPELLRHQCQFNLTELYARKLRKALSENEFTMDGYKEKTAHLYEVFRDRFAAERKRFSDEMALTPLRIDDWVSAVNDELKILSKFSDTLVVVKMR